LQSDIIITMYSKSKKIFLLILGVTAIVLSKILFSLFNDPEGPNLVVIIGAAVLLYVVSLLGYVPNSSDRKKFVVAIVIQVLLTIGLYLCLK
jgi:hypothetical protein